MSSTWQIKVGQNLSRPYTLEQLRTKLRNGTINESTECTEDRGATFSSVTGILDGHSEAEPRRERLTRPAAAGKASRFKKALQAMNDDAPLPGLATAEPDSLPLPPEPEQEPEEPSAPPVERKLFEGLSGAYRNVLSTAKELPASEWDDADDVHRPRPTIDLDAPAGAAVPATPPTPPTASPTGALSSPLSPAATSPGAAATPTPATSSSPATSVRNAAAQALAAQAARDEPQESPDLANVVPGKRPGQPAASSPSVADAAPPRRMRASSLLFIVLGVVAAGLVIWWFGSGSPSMEDLTGGSFALASTNGETLSLEELSARTQILGVQLTRVTRALASQDAESEPIELSDLPALPTAEPRLPLMPFHAEILSAAEADRSNDFRDRYTKLVQQQGPNGTALDAPVVDRYTGYLSFLAEHAGSEGTTRQEALYRLSEWTKLLYLMQYGRLSSDETRITREARQAVLNASNAGLERIFPELAAGDMRFVDVFERATEEERARLLLVRFWYYRADNPEYAQAWLEDSLQQIDEAHHADVHASIAEVEQIIGR